MVRRWPLCLTTPGSEPFSVSGAASCFEPPAKQAPIFDGRVDYLRAGSADLYQVGLCQDHPTWPDIADSSTFDKWNISAWTPDLVSPKVWVRLGGAPRVLSVGGAGGGGGGRVSRGS